MKLSFLLGSHALLLLLLLICLLLLLCEHKLAHLLEGDLVAVLVIELLGVAILVVELQLLLHVLVALLHLAFFLHLHHLVLG